MHSNSKTVIWDYTTVFKLVKKARYGVSRTSSHILKLWTREAWGQQLYQKMHKCFPGTLAQVFSRELCEISKNTFFTEHLWTTAFEYWSFFLVCWKDPSGNQRVKIFCFIIHMWHIIQSHVHQEHDAINNIIQSHVHQEHDANNN